jgi:hypothetical protein
MDNGTTPRGRRTPPRKAELAKATGRQPATSKRDRLRELERSIAEAKEQFWRIVGTALREIRRDKLYALTHRTWDEYLRDRWDLSRSYASRLIDGINTVEQLERTLVASGLSADVAHGQRGIRNEREARAIKGKVPVVAERVRQGMPVDEAITKTADEAEQQRKDHEQAKNRHPVAGRSPSGGHQAGSPTWRRNREREQERRELTLATWKRRLSDLLFDLEELSEEDRQAAITELREEVAGLE